MKVALVGNPNSGKSTLFNTLTGANQKIGNWPGVTIEKKIGVIKETDFELIDLPGIYSLNPYTKEEAVTSKFILENNADVLINIIDCNSISRGLYLTMQLLSLRKDIIIALNMVEIAENKGSKIDEEKLSFLLNGIPVIKISAINGNGVEQLIINLQSFKNKKTTKESKNFDLNSAIISSEQAIEQRYKTIDNILDEACTYTKKKKKSITDRIDKIVLNKFMAIPIFAVIMFAIYFLSIEVVGNNTINLISSLFDVASRNIEKILYQIGVLDVLVNLITNGIVTGISAVVSFLPQLMVLFISISFLEKVGYMSRISLIFDKLFRKLGISGNSVISFIIGTGCSVPGIMATKTIKNEREKKITAMLTPFIPCSAKLPIISLFATYFFREKTGLIAVTFYLLAIIVIVLSSILFKKLNKSSYKSGYISELPEYRFPKLKQVMKDSFERVWDFAKRAGSIILVSSIIIWILLSYSLKFEKADNIFNSIKAHYGANIEESILASIGKTFSWIFIPMVGENSWEVAVSSVQGLIAKEQVISSMAIIAGFENEDVNNNVFACGSPFEFFTPVAAYAYVCFNLFCAPCLGAISAMKKVFGNTRKTLIVVAYQIGVAYVISCAIFQIGNVVFK